MTENNNNTNIVERLADSHVGLRSDLQVSRHLFRGQPCYIVRDPITLQCHKLQQSQYQIITNITSDKSLNEIFENLVEQGLSENEHQEDFYKFILHLHQLSFLNLPINDSKKLYQRHQKREKAEFKSKLFAFLFYRFPLFDPDNFLEKTKHFAKPFFSPLAFIFWVALMLGGSFIIINRSTELFSALRNIFSTENLLYMWFTLIGLKVFHEFGHAYACKVFGGQVPDMGLYFIVFTPCAYVDVTSSWEFPRKRQRLIVALGGIYFESIIAMLALFLWAFSSSPAIKNFACNTFFLAGVMTVLMNANPLMRFDGYYVLADLLEMPNLRSRSQRHVVNLIKKIFLGINLPQNNDSRSINMIMLLFGIASSLYKITIVISISFVIASKFFLVGILLAAFYVGSTLLGLFSKIIIYLWKSPEAAPCRLRAVSVSVICLVVLPVVMFSTPVPHYAYAAGQVGCENENIIRAQSQGVITDILVKPGNHIQDNATLMKLENSQLNEQVLVAESKLLQATIDLQTSNGQGDSADQLAKKRKIVETFQSELDMYTELMDQLQISAKPGKCIFVLDHNNIGNFVKRGQPIATIVSGKWQLHALMDEQSVGQTAVKAGDKVQIRLKNFSNRILTGTIVLISPDAREQIDMPALTINGGGEILADPKTHMARQSYYKLIIEFDDIDNIDMTYGTTANVRISGPTMPIGKSLYHKFKLFLNNLNKE
ncbi:MAG: HlyD family efflux transporter periplasmic adaptor subunit [Phycisphaerae bacterium]|nr:HlyD family efflux transporter periplasmic adaptor subunit [Phycisphaerae bacterium]